MGSGTQYSRPGVDSYQNVEAQQLSRPAQVGSRGAEKAGPKRALGRPRPDPAVSQGRPPMRTILFLEAKKLPVLILPFLEDKKLPVLILPFLEDKKLPVLILPFWRIRSCP